MGSTSRTVNHKVSNTVYVTYNAAFQTNEAAVLHLLQTTQKLRLNNFAAE